MRRARAGTLMPCSESKSTRPSSTMRPRSGVSRPAMARRDMDLPEPDGPRKPRGAWSTENSTARRKPGICFSMAISRGILSRTGFQPVGFRIVLAGARDLDYPVECDRLQACPTFALCALAPDGQGAAICAVDDGENDEGEEQQDECCAVRYVVIRRLHLVVNIDRNGARYAGDVAADHEHHAEFADGVREAQHDAGDRAGGRERQNHAAKGLEARCAQRPGGFD